MRARPFFIAFAALLCMLVSAGGIPSGGAAAASSAPTASGEVPPLGPSISPNVDVITGSEQFPHVTQSESMVWGEGNTVVVAYNDSRALQTTGFSGVSVSNDGGATFTRLTPAPFVGHGSNLADPIVAYDHKLGSWFGGDVVVNGDCGPTGIGLWRSTDPATTWTPASCVHVGQMDDRPSMWVDNNVTSPHYGRMYVSWNDFARGAVLVLSHSDDGVSWSPETTLSSVFVRDVQLTGSPGSDGTVFVMGMLEGGGGFSPRRNAVLRSTDGGITWRAMLVGSTFPAAGDTLCPGLEYFPQIDPIWRDLGWGQPAVGPNGVVGYDFSAHGAGTDPSDVYFTRSTDNGSSWSTPIKLNTDASTKAQWMPSLLFTARGVALATWYDRTNTTDGENYQRIGRISTDNGATWGSEEPISDVLIPQPTQPDPTLNFHCYAGDYNYTSASGDIGYETWTDGRVAISNTPQQDVFFAKIPLAPLPRKVSDCMHSGWRQFSDGLGHAFKNQGDCVSFLATGGRNRGNG